MIRLIDEPEYAVIKEAQADGMSIEQTRKQMRRSWDTIRRAYNSTSWENYTVKRTGTGHVHGVAPEPPVVRELRAAREKMLEDVKAYDVVIANLVSQK